MINYWEEHYLINDNRSETTFIVKGKCFLDKTSFNDERRRINYTVSSAFLLESGESYVWNSMFLVYPKYLERNFSNISVKRILREEYIKIMKEHGFRY
jgi:hypothetical protein